ncbi:MAG: sarcosine oxidase subunit delta [Gammaproteobacteria bacterium]|nr:sarcosine oxidase subunit delta [Gammaproteobacteria bacterium]MDH3857327.1 sarcosine oxidase subunit delta [Gammaproteobacteria bacterium]
MLKIICPFCGPRNESEFIHGGPLKPRRTDDPGQLSEPQWIEYLTVPPNPIGPIDERWWHVRGCGRWITIRRDTLTHEILESGSDA